MATSRQSNRNKTVQPEQAPTLASDLTLTFVILLCGAVNAVNIAKLSPSISVLQAQFGLSLSQMGLLASLFSLLIVLTGVAIAGMVRIIGARRIVLLALLVAGGGSVISLVGQNAASLFAGRITEGVSLITVMLTAPSILARHTSIKRRGLIMGIWGGFMPFGNAAVFLAAPALLATSSWQGVWLASLAATILVIIAAFAIIPGDPPVTDRSFDWPGIKQAVRLPVLALLGLSFAAHSLIYQSLLQFMPLFNQQIAGLPLSWAAGFAAVFCILNFGGNVFSGQMIQKGRRPENIALAAGLLTAGLIAGLSQTGTFVIIFIALLLVTGFLTGWLPPVCFYLVSRQTSTTEAIPVFNAWMFQIQGLGMLCGPFMTARIVEKTHSWTAGILALVPFCVLIALFALGLRRLAARG